MPARIRDPLRRRATWFAAALVGLAAIGLWGATPRPSQEPTFLRPYPNQLPDGAGREIAERACLMCHAATLITQQTKDSTAWAKSVATMVKWGAPMAENEQDALVGYLASSIGPRRSKPPPPSIVVAPPPGNDAAIPGRPAFGQYVYVEELPEATTKVPPVYPAEARRAGVDGTVMVQVLVLEDGTVGECRIVKSVPALDDAAVAAARQWRFKPAMSKGQPVAVWVAVPIRFTLH